MGNLARDVLFRMPAHYVIHYSRSPALMNLMHRQVPATIPLLTQMAEIIIYCTDQTLTFIIVRELCMWTHAEEILNSVL